MKISAVVTQIELRDEYNKHFHTKFKISTAQKHVLLDKIFVVNNSRLWPQSFDKK